MNIYKTERGFRRADFEDQNGKACSIQESSVATDDLLWLGCDEGLHGAEGHCLARMHLSRSEAGALASMLRHFELHGYLMDDPEED